MPPAPALPTVHGPPLAPGAGARVDSHAHAWIEPPEGVDPASALALRDEPMQAAALSKFREAAAPRRAALVDCQPPRCGRDARALARLSRASGVAIAACTGFHLARYYPHGERPWNDADSAAKEFEQELRQGMAELPERKAALIKAAHSGVQGEDPAMWEAALAARERSDALLLIHTERGAQVEALLAELLGRGVPAAKVYLCHVDKRPDHALHRELASAGALLGYDTFVRPRYQPESTSWPLLQQMVEAGHAASVALGLDLAESAMWEDAGGPAALVRHLERELTARGFSAATTEALLGENLLRRATASSSERTGQSSVGQPPDPRTSHD